MNGTWAGGGEDLAVGVLDAFEPGVVSEEERAFAAALFAEQDACYDPVVDPAAPQYWAMVAEMTDAMAGEEPAGWAGEELAGALAGAARGLGRAPVGAGELVHVFDISLVEALAAAGRLRAQHDALIFALVADAAERGLHTAVGMGLVDWVALRCPQLPTAEVAQLKQVVDACATHWGAALGEAVRAGRVGTWRAAQVARTLTRLAPCLTFQQREAYASIATGAACDPAITDRDLARVCKKLLVDLLDEAPPPHHRGDDLGDDVCDGGDRAGGDGDRPGDAGRSGIAFGLGSGAEVTAGAAGADRRPSRQEIARGLRFLSRRPLGNGMTRYIMDAPEDDAAIFDGVLHGALARPAPGTDGGPDLRSAGTRRYDAFVATLTRGLGHPGAPPSTARASVMITVKADPATGRPYGAASTQTGQVLTAATSGRFACLGDLTPVVLGPHGEPIDLGRTQRLATPGQYKALIVRDEHCVWPGCTIPGLWCEAHHTTWWCRDGTTDLTRLALLCGRHHTQVHDTDLTITVNGARATVHL